MNEHSIEPEPEKAEESTPTGFSKAAPEDVSPNFNLAPPGYETEYNSGEDLDDCQTNSANSKE